MNAMIQNFVDNDQYFSVQRFLYGEASLLDQREYERWFSLFAEDFNYAVYAVVARDAGVKPVEYAIIDEGAEGLRSRIDQISNPRLTRAENPPSQARRFISNIEVAATEKADEVAVTSNVLAYRGRANILEGGFYVGQRRDILRKNGGGWLIARRDVHLDHTVMFDGALTTLL